MTTAGLRPRSLFGLFWKQGGWLSLVLVIVFAVLTALSSASHHRAVAMEDRGQSAVATFVSKRFSRSDDSTTYYITYRFVVGAREITAETSVGRGLYDRSVGGTQQEVWFLPETPENIDLERDAAANAAVVTQWVALVFGVLGLIALWFPGRWAVEAVRARRYGERRVAEVLEVKRTNVRVNNSRRYRLVWRDATGQEGVSLMRAFRFFDGYERGSEITVYAGLKRTWWERDLFR